MPFPYICDHCGKGFQRRSRTKKEHVYCSRDCYHADTIVYPTRECLGCGKQFDPRQPAPGCTTGRQDRAYCSRECMGSSRRVTKHCTVCGKEFSVSQSTADRYNTCSRACTTADTEYLNCERCGNRFLADKRYPRHHCSEECRRPPVYMDCANCGNCFRIVPSAPANGRRFCSRSCYRKFTGETMLEFRVRQALAALGISFVQELQVKNWTIDFALTEAWIALEADGEYWHQLRPESDAIKDRALRQMGWHVVRLAESDVNNAADLCELVLGRLQEVPGLELSRLPPASGGPERMIVRRSDRRPFRLKHRDAARVKPTTGITDGTLPLWGEDEITGPQGFDQDIA